MKVTRTCDLIYPLKTSVSFDTTLFKFSTTNNLDLLPNIIGNNLKETNTVKLQIEDVLLFNFPTSVPRF